MPDPTTIGWVANPYEMQIRQWLEALPRLAPLARQLASALNEAKGGSSTGWADPALQRAIPQLAEGGMSPEEEISAQRQIGDVYRSAVGAGGFAGGAGGSWSPRAVRRLASREAPQRLAPALSELMARRAQQKQAGREAAVGALTSIYPSQARQSEREQDELGRLLGPLLMGSGLGGGPRWSERGTYRGRSW